MKVTLCDTFTGETAEVSGVNTFQWTQHNWACDCNREAYFGHNAYNGDFCLGSKRYVVIAAEVESPDDWDATLQEMNEDYPADLLADVLKAKKIADTFVGNSTFGPDCLIKLRSNGSSKSISA